MLQIKLKICYQNIKNKCKLNPSPRLIQIDYDRHIANSFGGREKKHSKFHIHKHAVAHIFGLQSNGSVWEFILIFTNKIAEDHLTWPDVGLHTFSSNMLVTFFELHYCVFSIKKRDLIKEKL